MADINSYLEVIPQILSNFSSNQQHVGDIVKYCENSLRQGKEIAIALPLVILIFWMGIFPSDFLNWSKASLENLVQNRTHYQLNVEE